MQEITRKYKVYEFSELSEDAQDKAFELRKDGEAIYTGKTENECLEKLHDIFPGSWDHALKHEGYSIVKVV